ncbi:MAG TPA: polysaccharide deacetylase family protein, partial [Acidimicrobiales bacterium]|nr:polysaccharide deacetylase family protein [Acidimicrobiales bacterium]
KMAVAPDAFRRQMELLDHHRHQVPVLPLARAGQALASGPRRSVVLTFDDAWADNHAHALPALVAHRLPATLYVPSRLLGTPGYMAPSQLEEMVAAGVSVGGHTRTHPDLRRLGAEELEAEVRGGREDLEDLLGQPVVDFAYPSGLLDPRVVRAVARAGYRTAVTTRRGAMSASTPRLLIPRTFVEELAEPTFAAALRGGLTVLGPLEAVQARLRRPR